MQVLEVPTTSLLDAGLVPTAIIRIGTPTSTPALHPALLATAVPVHLHHAPPSTTPESITVTSRSRRGAPDADDGGDEDGDVETTTVPARSQARSGAARGGGGGKFIRLSKK